MLNPNAMEAFALSEPALLCLTTTLMLFAS